jgi:hypothetical protein
MVVLTVLANWIRHILNSCDFIAQVSLICLYGCLLNSIGWVQWPRMRQREAVFESGREVQGMHGRHGRQGTRYGSFSKHMHEHAYMYRVNVPNLAQVPNWRSLVKTSLELQSCPLFQISWRPKNLLGLLPWVKSMNLKEGTRLQLQRRFYQTCAKLGTFTLHNRHSTQEQDNGSFIKYYVGNV